MAERGEIIGGGNDRQLDERDKQLIAAGREPTGGNGKWVPFDKCSPETLAEYRQKTIETKRARSEGKRLAELQAYIEEHKEHAHKVFGAKLMIIEGLIQEMEVVNHRTGEVVHDTRMLDDRRLGILLKFMVQFEERGFGKIASKTEQNVNVNVSHQVAEMKERLQRGR